MTKFAKPHNTFTMGEDSPTPGGEANGEWNFLPEIPLTKWGTPLARKTPAKKWARYTYHSIRFFLLFGIGTSQNTFACFDGTSRLMLPHKATAVQIERQIGELLSVVSREKIGYN
jgi:hypothetical protein